MFSQKQICEQIIEEALCKISPAQNIRNNDQKHYHEYNDDGRELLLDDVTDLLNEIYQTLKRERALIQHK